MKQNSPENKAGRTMGWTWNTQERSSYESSYIAI